MLLNSGGTSAPEELVQIQNAQRPAYAFVPATADRCFVADLDRTMTVEKSIVSTWERTPGYTTDTECRLFAQALARKRARFAFPNDFVSFIGKLQNRLKDKHDKDSDEGRALRGLREIRVHASPSWHEAAIQITLWFIRKDVGEWVPGRVAAEILEKWLALVPDKSGRFMLAGGQFVALEDMTAKDYVDSDGLDLDHLSGDEQIRHI